MAVPQRGRAPSDRVARSACHRDSNASSNESVRVRRQFFANPRITFLAAMLATISFAGCSGQANSSAPASDPKPTSASITTQPANQTVKAGEAATFTVAASGTAPLPYQWRKNAGNLAGATTASYATPATSMADDGASFDVVVSNTLGSVTSASALLTVHPLTTASNRDVRTYHYDNQRTGKTLSEKTLTPANVNSAKFAKLGSFTVDGRVDAQPLYLANLPIPNQGARNVLYVVTEHDTVFAFDADSVTGATGAFLWKTSVLQPGESPSDDRGCGQVTPEIGITSTPVIDRTRNAVYVVAVSKDAGGNYFHRIHALDLTTGKELFGGPTTITASFPGTGAGSSGGTVVFDPRQYNERAGLLEINGTIYTTWSSHCDIGAYTSLGLSYRITTLKQTSRLNLEIGL